MKIKKITENLSKIAVVSMVGVLLLVPTLLLAPSVFASNHDCIELTIPIDGSDCIPKGGEGGNNPIMIYLRAIIRFLSAGVGLVVVGMIIVGGIQYASARDNPQAIEAARKKISNAIIGLILFIFMAAIMNFLIPGGIL